MGTGNVSADIPDGDFGGEIVLVARTVLDFVDVDVALCRPSLLSRQSLCTGEV